MSLPSVWMTGELALTALEPHAGVAAVALLKHAKRFTSENSLQMLFLV